jgi:hypothetical protein
MLVIKFMTQNEQFSNLQCRMPVLTKNKSFYLVCRPSSLDRLARPLLPVTVGDRMCVRVPCLRAISSAGKAARICFFDVYCGTYLFMW